MNKNIESSMNAIARGFGWWESGVADADVAKAEAHSPLPTAVWQNLGRAKIYFSY